MELIFPIVLVLLVAFMIFSVRRQKKAVSAVQDMQDNLQPGARVQTTSGLFATVVFVADGVVDLEIAPGVVTRWNKLAVREIVHPEDVDGSYVGAEPAKAIPDTPASLIDGDDDVDRSDVDDTDSSDGQSGSNGNTDKS